LGGEGREVTLGPILDFIEEQEVMIEVDTLVLRFTTPEEMNGWKREATGRLLGSKVEMADMVHGHPPDILYLWEPVWHCPSIGEASHLLII
jgi:hypothetical protein